MSIVPRFLPANLEWPKGLDMLTKVNLKTDKNKKHGVATISLQLAPAKESLNWNVCPFAGACAKICLKTAGHNRFR